MYVILKQLLPVVQGPEEFEYIDYCTDIPGDEVYKYESLTIANAKRIELVNDPRYAGRNLKIKECQ